ncbi:PKD domain-containing protein, partial [Halorubrum sp. Eb13]
MNDNTANRYTRTLAVLLATLTVLSMVGGVASAAGVTTLSVSPAQSDLTPGETTTVQVVLDDADGGVGSGQIGIQLSDPAVAEITGISAGESPGNSQPSISNDGSSANVLYAFDNTTDTGAVTVLTVTLEGQSPGTTSLSIVSPAEAGGPDQILEFGDEGGTPYTISQTDSATVTVTDPNTAPTAAVSGPSSAQVGEQVSFDASGSSDADGSIESYEWEFDDGTTATGASASHTYDAAGDYEVALTVTDDDGATDTATQTVSVSEAPDPASFQVSSLNAESPVTQGDDASVTATV